MQFKLTKEFIGILNSKIGEKDNQWIMENVFELHHADIADILDELSTKNAKYVYYLGEEEIQADILMDLQEENRESLIDTLSTKEIADQIENKNVFIARMELANPDLLYRPGMRGRARIKSDRHPLIWNFLHKPYHALRHALGW